jgi:siderophore synthetase component
MQQAMSEQGLDAGSTTEIESLIKQHVQSQIGEGIYAHQSQKTNLEESSFLELEQEVSTFFPIPRR